MKLLFDWGGVLAPDDSLASARHLARAYQCDEDALHAMLANEDAYSISADYQGFLEAIRERFGIPHEEIIRWKNHADPNETFQLCHALAGEGFELHLLSDQMQFRADYIREHFDLSCFTSVCFSCEIGLMKSDTKAFEYVLRSASLQADEVLFIDDWQTNLDVAKQVGLQTLLYKDLERLMSDLSQQWGITVSHQKPSAY